MKILIVGAGGREHALAWKIKQSPLVTDVFCAPGNGGIAEIAECLDIQADDVKGLLSYAKKNKIDLTVVGPEVPLVSGIVDEFEKEGLKIFGPSKIAAKLEGSKVLAKEFMYEYKIPTAPFITFNNAKDAKGFLTQAEYPLVVKADGLAAGKGVIICENVQEANTAVEQIMEQKIFNEAGNNLVIEECLEGEEVSVMAICDGKDYCILESSQDHKRIFDDDLGPNTGGMGAYSPAPALSRDLLEEVEDYIINPVVEGMRNEGTPFKGVLYAGLMLTEDGPMVLEFNVRFGDPETQAVLPRLKSDLVEIMLAACNGKINKLNLSWYDKSCVSVVMSSGGYPAKYEKGKEITGLKKVAKKKDVVVFHAGTKKDGKKIVTSSGRVLGVTALGDDIEAAIENAYSAVEEIRFDRCFFRRDIGAKALNKVSLIDRA